MGSELLKLQRCFEGKGPQLERWLLKRGHPILVANDSDPLAKTNTETFYALHDICRKYDHTLVYQTKGGSLSDEERILSDFPTVFYISITSDNEDFLRKAEPGAPSFEQRMDLAKRAKARGHHVIWGLNPMMPGWWLDFDAVVSRFAALNIRHVWYGLLHLSRFQQPNIPAPVAKTFADDISYAMVRKKSNMSDIEEMLMDLEDHGMNHFNNDWSSAGSFWEPMFKMGIPWYPTLNDWFWFLMDNCKGVADGKPIIFSLEEFQGWADIGCGVESSLFTDFCQNFGRSARNIGIEPNPNTYAQVHEWLWKADAFPTKFRDDHIRFVVKGRTKTNPGQLVVDENGRHLFAFSKNIIHDAVIDLEKTTSIDESFVKPEN